MPHTKIATCCYCGTRSALVLKGRERHELACASCGAPLHELKMLRADAAGERELVRPTPGRFSPGTKMHRAPKTYPSRKRKGVKTLFGSALLKAAEDIFDAVDDVLDIFD